MNGKKIFCIAGLLVLLLSGCAGEQGRMNYLGEEEAKQTALKEAGFLAEEVEFTGTALNNHSGMDYYQIDFTAAGEDYEYDIDAITGVVINADVPSKDTDSAADTETADMRESGGSSEKNSDDGSSADTKMITSEDAKAKALAHAGLTDGQVTFVKSTPDYDDGIQVYEVEFYTQDKKEYDYEIDAHTGEVISFDYDAENYTPSASGTMITVEAAKELALAQVPGASSNDISEFEVDYDDGHTEYEGKILYNGMEYEFSIDSYSGTFRGWEAEPVDD